MESAKSALLSEHPKEIVCAYLGLLDESTGASQTTLRLYLKGGRTRTVHGDAALAVWRELHLLSVQHPEYNPQDAI